MSDMDWRWGHAAMGIPLVLLYVAMLVGGYIVWQLEMPVPFRVMLVCMAGVPAFCLVATVAVIVQDIREALWNRGRR